MARFLYRILRVSNLVASMEETELRRAMSSSSVMQRLQTLIAADLDKPLSYVLPLTGVAMAPLLNATVPDMAGSNDRLVIRRLSGSTQTFLNRVYVDDVVVIRDPHDERRKYVRRIAALEGADMASRRGDPSFRIPASHCWVERENTRVDAPDSTSFGPLSLDLVLGRVMYAIRSATDHARVVNSPYAMASDSIVLAHEPVTKHITDAPPNAPKPPSESADGTPSSKGSSGQDGG